VFGIVGFHVWANNKVSGRANRIDGQMASTVEQILSSIRIVQAFDMGATVIKRMDDSFCRQSRRLGMKRAFIRSSKQSSVYFALFLTYSLTFWFGGKEVKRGLDTGRVITVSCVFFRTRRLGQSNERLKDALSDIQQFVVNVVYVSKPCTSDDQDYGCLGCSQRAPPAS
jgi:ABC-type multidrug transport system fused ATPase/permease subunit